MVKPKSRKTDKNPFTYEGYDPLAPAGKPELVIGIVGPAGVDRSKLIKVIRSELKEYSYESIYIKLSLLMDLLPSGGPNNYGNEEPKSEANRINSLMDRGNWIREASKKGDALALLAVSEIQRKRSLLNEDEDKDPFQAREATAYILDSIKHPQEISTLRATYGNGFILISAYSRKENKIKYLAKKIAQSKFQPQGENSARPDAEHIINRDEKEDHTIYGQNVRSCFPKADFFVDVDTTEVNLKHQVDRFFQTQFGNPFITPSKDESGMVFAESASWRSADLARQVGAAISDSHGNLIAVGCNEVAKAGGGLYWENDEPDGRDFQFGHDEGADKKRLMLAEIYRRLADSKQFDDKAKLKFEELVKKSISGDEDDLLDGLQALNVIEFGRTVHAEMAALMDATFRGISVKGATMYVNTFPCHICARHIISSGITRLVYIEPYPKSFSESLFSDAIATDRNSWNNKRVLFESFTGIAPRTYQFSFKLISKRKDSMGQVIDWKKKTANTKLKRFVTSYMAIEHEITGKLLKELIKQLEEAKNG